MHKSYQFLTYCGANFKSKFPEIFFHNLNSHFYSYLNTKKVPFSTGSLCEWLVESELESIDLQQVLIDTGKGEKWTFFVALYYTMNTVSTIGFGDLYIHCPGHFVLVLKPIVCLMLTALLIAIFSIAFSRIQNTMDKKVAKDALKTREEVKFMMKNKAAIDSVENAECDFKL